MKAIVQARYGSADVLELREIDRPTASDDEVRAALPDLKVVLLPIGSATCLASFQSKG